MHSSILYAAIALLLTFHCGHCAPLTRPRFFIYSDQETGSNGPPPVDQLTGYNVYALSFLQTDKAYDKAAEWENLEPQQRSQIKSEYEAAGIKIIVSLFGGNNWPTSGTGGTVKIDPTVFAQTAADWVKTNGVDGVDVDYEDNPAFNAGDGSAENWLITFTKALRPLLPPGSIMSHAPQAPWFSPQKYHGGGYMKIHEAVGDMIDWYNVQFYNQGGRSYATCNSLLNSAGISGTSVFEMAKAGIPLDKIVIGKSLINGTAGWIEPATLAECLQQAKGQGWNAGVMAWQFPDTARWIKTVRSHAFPIDGSASRREVSEAISGKDKTSTPSTSKRSDIAARNIADSSVRSVASSVSSPTESGRSRVSIARSLETNRFPRPVSQESRVSKRSIAHRRTRELAHARAYDRRRAKATRRRLSWEK